MEKSSYFHSMLCVVVLSFVPLVAVADYEIKSGKDAMKLPGIGKGIAARIDEILATGTLEQLSEEIVVDPYTKTLNGLNLLGLIATSERS